METKERKEKGKKPSVGFLVIADIMRLRPFKPLATLFCLVLVSSAPHIPITIVVITYAKKLFKNVFVAIGAAAVFVFVVFFLCVFILVSIIANAWPTIPNENDRLEIW